MTHDRPRAVRSTQQQKQLETSKENMRRFIKAGAKFSMGTDTGSFLNFQQEDPNANEMMYMVEMGMTPMQAIEASTRNGAEALGLLKDLGTIEKGKLADVIVVAGNPLQNMAAMKRVPTSSRAASATSERRPAFETPRDRMERAEDARRQSPADRWR